MIGTAPTGTTPAVGRPRMQPVHPAAAVAALAVAAGAGAVTGLLGIAGPALVAVGILFGTTMVRPLVGVVVLLAIGPLVTGIDRGAVLPLLRPNEALLLLVCAAVAARALFDALAGHRPSTRRNPLDIALLALAMTSSLTPLLWMTGRGRDPTVDDLLHALTLWKYAGLYTAVRFAVRNAAAVRVCLTAVLASAVVVAAVAVLQALQLLGVQQLLAGAYAPFGDEGSLTINRGTSTLASSIATADVMVFSLAVTVAWVLRGGPARRLLPVAAVLLAGTLAAGQASGLIGLAVALGVVGVLTGQGRLLRRITLVALPLAVVAFLPVLRRRAEDLDPASGIPHSWVVRLDNLRTYFWPELGRDFNYLLGVRPSSRIATDYYSHGYVWIESGHTWLLWNGGIPLAVAFVAFSVVSWRACRRVVADPADDRADEVGTAAVAACAATAVVAVLMTFDAHLAMRGAADLLFPLLALATTRLWRDPGPRFA